MQNQVEDGNGKRYKTQPWKRKKPLKVDQ